jgi:hypothetical protein
MGAYKLWLMMIDMYGRNYVMGRDRFFVVLRRHGLMLPPPRPRHTTNSNHRYHKWKNLIKDIILTAANQLWVVDITYIATAEGVCYLHLVTDAYSHKVVGWVLSDTLRASASIEALRQAIKQAVAMTGSNMLKGLTHHSDTNKEAFNDAVKTAMTQQYQTDEKGNVMKDANGNKIKLPYGSVYFSDTKSVDYYAPTQADIDELMTIINGTTKVLKYDTNITDIINDESKAYFDGEKSAEETAKLVQSRVSIYVNEQG